MVALANDHGELQAQLREALETLDAIRHGGIDSLVIGAPGEERVYSLTGADRSYRLLVDSMNEGAATISADGIILYANQQLTTMVGRPAGALAGTDAVALAAPRHRPVMGRLLRTGHDDRARHELDLQSADGTRTPTQVSVSCFELDGTLLRCLVATDLTEQRQATRRLGDALRALEASQHRYQVLAEAATDGILIHDSGGRVLFANHALRAMVGLDEHQPLPRMGDLLAGEHAERLPGSGATARRTQYEGQLVAAGGHRLPVELTAVTLEEPGAGGNTLLNLRDISERKAREAEASLLSAVVTSSFDAIVGMTLDGTVLSWNAAAQTLFGYTADEMIGQPIGRLAPPGDAAESQAVLARIRAGESVRTYESVRRRKDGSVVDVSLSISPIRDTTGAIIGASKIARDITELKRTRDALRTSEQRLAGILNTQGAMVARADLDHRITYMNAAYASTSGLRVGDSLLSGMELGHAEATSRAITGLVTPPFRISLETRSQVHGETRSILWEYAAILDPDGTCREIQAMGIDVTETRAIEADIRRLNAELEERVRLRTAALESANRELEAFSYSVSHDLRAPLRAIDSFSRILLAEHADQLEDEGRRLLGIVVRNARQMGGLIDDLLAFARVARKELERRPVDMTALAKAAAAELAAAEPGRELAFDIGDLCVASGDAGLLRQVWVNLLTNAAKFTRPAARPAIQVRSEPAEELCRYTVRDNGVGFDPAYKDQLFRPFQRLHPSSEFEGSGIGLAIVSRIVQRHGGRVWAEGAVGEGATFGFELPQRPPEDA